MQFFNQTDIIHRLCISYFIKKYVSHITPPPRFNPDDVVIKKEYLVSSISNQPQIHIAFAADKNYVRHIGTAAYSVLSNNPNDSVCFHFFIEDISETDKEKFQLLAESFNFSIILYYLNTDFFNTLPTMAYFSAAMYYRLVMPTVLKQITHRFLYLDCDVLCLNKLTELFELDMQGKTVAAVADWYFATQPADTAAGFNSCTIYINSGVLLIDTEKWAATDTDTRLLQQIETYIENNIGFNDQHLLNAVLKNQIFHLSERYNWQHWRWCSDIYEGVYLAHLLGSDKPWQYSFIRRTVYDHYHNSSPWRDNLFLPPRPNDQAKAFRRYAVYLWHKGYRLSALRVYSNFLYKKCFKL